MKNDWDIAVFHAVVKRYGLTAYRYRKQRKSTILVRCSKQFMHELLWPIYAELSNGLHVRFTQLTTALLPAIAPAPYSITILDHEHESGPLCDDCRDRLLGQT